MKKEMTARWTATSKYCLETISLLKTWSGSSVG